MTRSPRFAWPLVLSLLFVAAAMLAPAARQARAETRTELPELVTKQSENAVKSGLAFLAKNQSQDGSFRAQGGYGGGYPTAMTALAGLAFLSAGNTPLEGPYAKNVRRATDFLVLKAADRQTGLIAVLNRERSCMHGHGFAMLFLGEVYGMETDPARQKRIRDCLERAIKLSARSQSAAGGWYYQPNSGSDEGSITVTIIHGLRSCRNAGIKVPKAVIDKACDYIKKSSNSDGGISYRVGQSGSRPAITAAAVSTMYNGGEYEHPVAKKALAYMKKLLKANGNALGGGHRYYAIFYAAQGMYLTTDKDDPANRDNWKSYFPRCRDDLISKQVKSGSLKGSWNGDGVGSVYGTSIAIVTMQLPYAYLPIFQR